MLIYESGTLVSTLMQLGLVDEYQLWVNPVVLGQGKPFFSRLTQRANLNLLRTTVFKNGAVALYYAPAKS